MLKDLCVSDQVFYWFTSGNQTSMIKFEVVLQEEVDESTLKYAVMRAMQIHSSFRSHPVIVKGRVKVSIDDDITDVPVFAASDKTRKIGTEDTCGYLFYFSYQRNELVCNMFHGLSDGLPSYEFMKTVMNFYFERDKGIHFDQPEPDRMDGEGMYEHVMKESFNGTDVGRFDANDHADDVFHIPEELFELNSRKWRSFEIEIPLEPLLNLARSNGTSVLPLFDAIIGNTIRKQYDVGDKMVVAYTPVDMRRIFGYETMNNGATAVAIPYRPMMDGLDLRERASLLRRILDYQIRPENIRNGLESIYDSCIQADSQPYPIEQIVTAIKWMRAKKKFVEPYTYALSYPGKITFSEQVEPFIASLNIIASVSDVPLMMAACENKGIIHLVAVQTFDNDELVKAIYRDIAAAIPDTKFKDCGLSIYDRLDFEKLEHID